MGVDIETIFDLAEGDNEGKEKQEEKESSQVEDM